MYKLYLYLGRILFGKPFIEGKEFVYEAWKPEEDGTYFYPFITRVRPEASSSTFSDYEIERYLAGNAPYVFRSKEDAMEASVRARKAMVDLHEDLGY